MIRLKLKIKFCVSYCKCCVFIFSSIRCYNKFPRLSLNKVNFIINQRHFKGSLNITYLFQWYRYFNISSSVIIFLASYFLFIYKQFTIMISTSRINNIIIIVIIIIIIIIIIDIIIIVIIILIITSMVIISIVWP